MAVDADAVRTPPAATVCASRTKHAVSAPAYPQLVSLRRLRTDAEAHAWDVKAKRCRFCSDKATHSAAWLYRDGDKRFEALCEYHAYHEKRSHNLPND
jgi:hypothetical protein